MSVFIVVAVIILITLLWYHCMPFILDQIRLYKSSLHFPGPIAYPFIGNTHLFLGDSTKIWNSIIKLCVTYTSPFRIWIGPKLYFVVTDPDDIKIIFTNHHTLEKCEIYDVLKAGLGEGLFTARVERWRRSRKLMLPAFNIKVLKSFISVFSKNAFIMAKELKSELDKDEFDISKYTSSYSFSTSFENTLGVDTEMESGKKSSWIEAVSRAMDILGEKLFKPWLQLDIIFNCTSLPSEFQKCMKYIKPAMDDIIQKRKLDFKAKKSAEHSVSPHQTSFLNLLMELSNTGDTFNDAQLFDETSTMIVAGSETTAFTLSFLLLMLAMFPEVQEKVYQELYDIYGSSDPDDVPVTYQDLQYMDYMDRVIKETLRCFPAGGIIARKVTEDVQLNKQVLPKGSSAVVGIYAVHHDEKYWPDPFKFDPDRFLPEKIKDRHRYCYIPFSAGPRNCLGAKYGELAIKIVLGTLVRKFSFKQNKYKTIDEIKLRIEIVLKSVEAINLRIEKRN